MRWQKGEPRSWNSGQDRIIFSSKTQKLAKKQQEYLLTCLHFKLHMMQRKTGEVPKVTVHKTLLLIKKIKEKKNFTTHNT